MKKKLVGALLILAVVTVFSGCGNKTGESADAISPGKTYNGIDVSKPEVIKMYLIGDRPNDLDTVWAEINKKLSEKVNAAVEISFLSWAEHPQKYSLLFSGGEDFDLIFTASFWAHYETTAGMGGFYPLTTDFVQKYAPGIASTVPQAAWDQAVINGAIYMVPQYHNEFNMDLFAIRGDLMEKYGYKDITSLDEVIEFFTKVAADQNKTGISPRGNVTHGMIYENMESMGYGVLGGSIQQLFLYHTQDPNDTKVVYLPEWEYFEKYCRDMKKYYDLGFWSKDSLASTDQRQDGLLRGSSASILWNLGSLRNFAVEANKTHPEWNVRLVDFMPNVPKVVASYINAGVSINAASTKKERAMMVLDLLYTDREIHDMAELGIAGVHWEAAGEKEFKKLAKAADFGSYCTWGWRNMNLTRVEYTPEPTAVQIKAAELEAAWNNNIKPAHPLDGIAIDKSAITSEVAMVESIIAEYYIPLLSGMAGDVPTAIAALKQQLEAAGIRKIIDQFNTQAAAHAAAKK